MKHETPVLQINQETEFSWNISSYVDFENRHIFTAKWVC